MGNSYDHDCADATTFEEELGPSAKIWSVYVSETEKQDKTLAQDCQRDMDALLIFTGLFSASLTAFIIESYKNLKPSADDATVVLLQQISYQLSINMYNSSSNPPVTPTALEAKNSFTPPTAVVICNLLWFLSLGFCLACALTATLADQWARNYLQTTQNRSIPSERARIRAYLYRGLERFGMKTVVDVIPMLLHTSLFLFYLGLVMFLIPVNQPVTAIAVLILAGSVVLYTWCTILPVIFSDCPYRTPASPWFWRALRTLRGYRYPCRSSANPQPVTEASQPRSNMAQAAMLDAIRKSVDREERDLGVLASTIESLDASGQLVGFVNQHRLTDSVDIRHLTTMVLHTDLTARIQRSLDVCGSWHPDEKHHRIPACLRAISTVADVWTKRVSSGKTGRIYFCTRTVAGLCQSEVVDNSSRVLRRNTLFRVLWPMFLEFITLAGEIQDILDRLVKANQDVDASRTLTESLSQQLRNSGLESRMTTMFHEIYLLLEGTKSGGSLVPLLSYYASFFSRLDNIWPLCVDMTRILDPSPHSPPIRHDAATIKYTKERCRELHTGLCDAQLFLLMDTLETYSSTNASELSIDWGQCSAQLSRCPISSLAQERLLLVLMKYDKDLAGRRGPDPDCCQWEVRHPLLLLRGLIRDQNLLRAAPEVWQAESEIVLVRGGVFLRIPL